MKWPKMMAFCLFMVLLVSGCQQNSLSPQDPADLTSNGLMKPSGHSWKVPGDFATIQEAVDNASNGDFISVGRGNFDGALVSKSVTIKGTGGTVINNGPLHPAGLSQGFRLLGGSDGTTLSQLTFTTDLSIINGEAVNNVTVDHCEFYNSVQAISNWRGSGWTITQNKIVDLRTVCGGGIGILIGDYSDGEIMNNVVSHNKISGTLHVSSGDCGGYNGSGIVLYADFRFGRAGTMEISGNRVVNNSVAMTSDNPSVVDVVAFEMTDTRDDESLIVIRGNAIGFNDFRGTAMQIDLTPDNLDEHNNISRNLGENRGHGLHPKLLGPGN